KDDIQRQDVHVHRLELEQQRLDDGHVGLLQKIQDVHLLGIERVVEAGGNVGDFSHIDGEQKDMGDVDLPGPAQDTGAGDDKAALAHGSAVDEGCGVAGNKDENLGRVAKAVVADRDPAHDVGGDMVEKNEPKRDPAEQVEPQIASGRHRGGMHS